MVPPSIAALRLWVLAGAGRMLGSAVGVAVVVVDGRVSAKAEVVAVGREAEIVEMVDGRFRESFCGDWKIDINIYRAYGCV